MPKLQSNQPEVRKIQKTKTEPVVSSPPKNTKLKEKPTKEISPNENKRISSKTKSSSKKLSSPPRSPSPPSVRRQSRIRRYDSDSDTEATNAKAQTAQSKSSKQSADSKQSAPAPTESASETKQKKRRKRNRQETAEAPLQVTGEDINIDGGIIEDTPPTPPTKKRRTYPKKRPEVTFEDGTY